MKISTKLVLFALMSISFLNCSKDKEEELGITNATIVLRDAEDNPAPAGIVVYAYNQNVWNVIGDNPTHADGQAASDSGGEAHFSNIDYPAAFTEANNNQHTFRFSAHYSLNGENKKKHIAITFSKGDSKTSTIVLN